MIRFSHRVPDNFSPNRITEKTLNKIDVDLTVSNPTLVDLFPESEFPPYEPDPRGSLEIRKLISPFDPEHIWLTQGTSEAYSFLFKLLADPGDEILIPSPSYPLFEHLLSIEGIRSVPYPITYGKSWNIDLSRLASQLNSKSKAVILVHPNNPTGSYISEEEKKILFELCERKQVALIVDEVFLSYPFAKNVDARSFTQETPNSPLFVLDGFSKQYGLPQMKISWIHARGPMELLKEIEPRLDWVSDLFLSVGAPSQEMVLQWIKKGEERKEAIHTRIRTNWRMLNEKLQSVSSIQNRSGEAGWSTLLELPSNINEEDFVLKLLQNHNVKAYPGYFFDLPFTSSLVLSLLPREADFQRGLESLLECVKREI